MYARLIAMARKCKYMLGGHPCLAGIHLPYEDWCQPCQNAARELCKSTLDRLADLILESKPEGEGVATHA